MKSLVLLFGLLLGLVQGSAADPRTENVFLITLDGMRWEEVFSGAEDALIGKNGSVADTNIIRKAFWRPTPEERRAALLPFFWDTIATQGQLFGNQKKGSVVKVTNGKNFTYPGFNEILAGFGDPQIDSNAKKYNSNVTVLEWLVRFPEFKGKVAAFANWDVFPYIMNAPRAGIPIWTGYREGSLADASQEMSLVRKLTEGITPVWDGMNFDVFFHHASLEYARAKRPRVVWIAYSETDEWAHEGRYDHYLQAAHRIDGYVRELWNSLQKLRQYKNKTTIILTTDHGRGSGPQAWRDHGEKVAGAENIWIALLGPDTPPLGERQNAPPAAQNQVAATIAALLGRDYNAAQPKAGSVLPGALK